MEQFRMRLNCIDHYQANPSHFDPQLFPNGGSHQRNPPKVPVIRIFGSTETGQKVCAHVHGAFPYLYIEYDGSLAPDQGKNTENFALWVLQAEISLLVGDYIYRLHLSIDHALGVSYSRTVYGENPR